MTPPTIWPYYPDPATNPRLSRADRIVLVAVVVVKVVVVGGMIVAIGRGI